MRGKGEGSVFKDSRGLWNGVIELPPLNGERRRKKIRRKNKAELLQAMAEAKAELQRLGDLPTKNQTVEQWFGYWLKRVVKEVRPNTYDGYQRTVHNHIIPAIGKVKLDKLTATHVRRVHDGIIAKGLSSTTALLAHRTMSVSFKMAVQEGRIGRNPCTLTAAPRKARSTLEALDLNEALRFLEHVLQGNPRAAQWATALLTGARRGEVIGLEVNRIGDALDLSWQLQRIRWLHGCGKDNCGRKRAAECPKRKTDDMPADYEYHPIKGGLYWTRPKSSKSWRIVPLVDPLKSILSKHLEAMEPNQWGLVFTNNGLPVSPDQASRDWRTDLAASGITKNVRLHDARHTTVDLLYEAGLPEDIIGDIIGHSVRATTRGYRSPQNMKRLLLAMEQFSLMLTQPEQKRTREISA